MIDIVKRYICDSCKKQVCVGTEEEVLGWEQTEVGDLCPVCARSWAELKSSFIVRMRKENGEALV